MIKTLAWQRGAEAVSHPPVVILGDLGDPHVQSVVTHIPDERALVVFDAASLKRLHFCVSNEETAVETVNNRGLARLDTWHRGWVRRPVPSQWALGSVLGSKRSAVNSSWQSLVTALMRNPRCEWLSKFETLIAAENKIAQLWAATRLQEETPRTVVSNSVVKAGAAGERTIAKPLGAEQFWESSSDGRHVFASEVDLNDPRVSNVLGGAPFLVQNRLSARRHLRIVTVCDNVWVFELVASGLPLDWRESVMAHCSWRRTTSTPGIEERALRMCEELGVRYSSQDWIETADGIYFIDLNPGGQWLFLPAACALQISAALAAWLTAPRRS